LPSGSAAAPRGKEARAKSNLPLSLRFDPVEAMEDWESTRAGEGKSSPKNADMFTRS
jgi:hypothetical protein